MKSICFFSSYYSTPGFPPYVRFYLSELKRHFSEIVFLTNEREIQPDDLKFLQDGNIAYRLYKNEGFDFGMWYKAFQEYDVTEYDRIGLINDSCILFRSLDSFFAWTNNEFLDYCGMTDCNLSGYHVQSYFIIINKRAILTVKDYFQKNGLIRDIIQVIKVYEVGLSTYLIDSGLAVKAWFSFKDDNAFGDPSWMQAKNLMGQGFPLVKKRILARNYGKTDYRYLVARGFDANPSHYIKLIKKGNDSSKTNALLAGVTTRMNLFLELKFRFICFMSFIYGVVRGTYKKVK